MITLDVQDYCQNCKYFKVKQFTLTYAAADKTEEYTTTLKCENHDKCHKIYDHIANTIKED